MRSFLIFLIYIAQAPLALSGQFQRQNELIAPIMRQAMDQGQIQQLNPRAQMIPQTFPPAPIVMPENASQEDCALAQVRRELRESRSAFAASQIRFFRNPEVHLYEFIVSDVFAGKDYYAHVNTLAMRQQDARGEARAILCSLVAHPMLPVFLLSETANQRDGMLAEGRVIIERFPSNY